MGWIEDFVDAKITGKKFDTKFFEMVNAIEKAFRMMQTDLILLEPNFKTYKFSRLIAETFSSCEVFNADPDSRKDYELSEEELRDFVRNKIPQIWTFYA